VLIKNITYTAMSALYFELTYHRNWQWGSSNRTKWYNKRDDFNLQILNSLFLLSNIPKTKEKQRPQYWSRHSTDHTGLIQYISIIMKIFSSKNSCLSIVVVSHIKYSGFHCLHRFILFHLLARPQMSQSWAVDFWISSITFVLLGSF
jgi:hypothetical protein